MGKYRPGGLGRSARLPPSEAARRSASRIATRISRS